LAGRKQIKYAYHDRDGGACAMGLLHEAYHQSAEAAVECFYAGRAIKCVDGVRSRFDLSWDEEFDIINRNNGITRESQDFLTIARKVGTGE
jgi:hypothetical protein